MLKILVLFNFYGYQGDATGVLQKVHVIYPIMPVPSQKDTKENLPCVKPVHAYEYLC